MNGISSPHSRGGLLRNDNHMCDACSYSCSAFPTIRSSITFKPHDDKRFYKHQWERLINGHPQRGYTHTWPDRDINKSMTTAIAHTHTHRPSWRDPSWASAFTCMHNVAVYTHARWHWLAGNALVYMLIAIEFQVGRV